MFTGSPDAASTVRIITSPNGTGVLARTRSANCSVARHNRRVQSVWDAIWPMAVAGALSPSITVIVLAILMRPDRPQARALAFWAGAVLRDARVGILGVERDVGTCHRHRA